MNEHEFISELKRESISILNNEIHEINTCIIIRNVFLVFIILYIAAYEEYSNEKLIVTKFNTIFLLCTIIYPVCYSIVYIFIKSNICYRGNSIIFHHDEIRYSLAFAYIYQLKPITEEEINNYILKAIISTEKSVKGSYDKVPKDELFPVLIRYIIVLWTYETLGNC